MNGGRDKELDGLFLKTSPNYVPINDAKGPLSTDFASLIPPANDMRETEESSKFCPLPTLDFWSSSHP